MPAGGGDDVLETATRIHEAVEEPFEIGGPLARGQGLGRRRAVPGRCVGFRHSRAVRRCGDVCGKAEPQQRIELYNPAVDVSSRESLSLGSEAPARPRRRRHRRALPAEGRGLERPDRRCRGRSSAGPPRARDRPAVAVPAGRAAGRADERALRPSSCVARPPRRPPGRGTGSTSGSRSTSTSTRCSTPHSPDASRRFSRRWPSRPSS